jgi:hypothetical protein
MNIPGSYFCSLQTIFRVENRVKILKFFDVDPDPGSRFFLTLDPGSGIENADPGCLSRIRGHKI